MGRGGTHLPFRSPTISVWLPRSCGLLKVFKWLCTSETSGCLIYPVPHILSLYLMLRRWLLKSRWRWEMAPWVRTLAMQAWGTQSLSQRPHKKPGLAAQTYIPCTVLSWGDGGKVIEIFPWPLECTDTAPTQTHACTPYTRRSNAHTQQ